MSKDKKPMSKKKIMYIVGGIVVFCVFCVIVAPFLPDKEPATSPTPSAVVTPTPTPSAPAPTVSASQEPTIPTVAKLFDLSAVAKKTSDEVKAVLGEPSGSGDTLTYMDGAVEVNYVDDVAARITVTPTESIPYDELDPNAQAAALDLIGVEWAMPKSEDKNLLSVHWYGLADTYEITVFNKEKNDDANDTVDYIYVIAAEQYK